MPVLLHDGLQFKTIKTLAKPGSWRRGYGYYRTKGQVQDIALNEQGVIGHVKGNYKDAYTIQLVFTPESVHAQCDCPLEEEWCKHAVSVALKAIDAHLYESFLNLPVADPPPVCPPLAETLDLEGCYRFGLGWTIKPKCLSLRLWNRRDQTDVTSLEPILRAALALQQSGQLALNPAERRELKIIQHIYPFAKSGSDAEGWYHIPKEGQEALIKLLSEVEEVCDADAQTLFSFETTPLHLLISVNASMVGNVLVSLHWHQDAPIEDIYPLEEVHAFARDLAWGVRNHHIFPLAKPLNALPGYLTRNTFYDVRDADGGKFVFEELPKLKNVVDIERAEVIDKATLEQEPPKKILTLRRVDESRLRVELEFVYDETRIAYSKTPEAPYVTIINKAEESIYWLKREKRSEEKAFKALVNSHLQHLQSNHFEAEGDDAIDFFNVDLAHLVAEGWVTETDDAFEDLRLSPDPLKLVGHLAFAQDNVDRFELALMCAIGSETLDLDTVRGFFVQGKKYVHVDHKGWVEIPLAEVLQLTRTLNAFDKDEVGPDTYQIRTYQAGLLSELAEGGLVMSMTPEFQRFWDLISSFSSLESVDIPEGVNAQLRPYQKHGFNWLWFLYTYGLNGILADDMGLGKTLQTLVLLQKAKDQDGVMPALIVCPTSVVYNWKKECEKFTPGLSILNLTGPDRHHRLKKIPETDIVITSYALLRRDIDILKQFAFRYIILDESQNIKNVESQTAQASKRLNAQHRLALSGTPIENHLAELWSGFDFLMPGFLYDLDEFRQRFVSQIEDKGNRDAERRLKKQISPFILRRLKRDVAKDLPDKIESTAYCEMLPEQQELYMEVLEETRTALFAEYNAKGQTVNQASVLKALLRLRQVCCHPSLLKNHDSAASVGSGKFETLMELLEEIISEGHRILLFSQFVEMLKVIQAWLQKKGIRHEYLTGETKDRQERVDRFNEDASIPVFLISLKAGGTGLNLTGADYVIHYDPWWNPAVEDQATDRAYRIGQTKKVMVYRLITRGTVEEKIMKLKAQKRDLVDTIISVDRDMVKSLSFQDLKEILTPDF